MTQKNKPTDNVSSIAPRHLWHVMLLVLVFIGISGALANQFNSMTIDDPLLLDSTVGELAIWMADQTTEDEIESLIAQSAENWAQSLGQESLEPEIILDFMQNGLFLWAGFITVSAIIALGMCFFRPAWLRPTLLVSLLSIDALLFIIPVIDGNNTYLWVIAGIIALLIALLLAPGKVSKVMGFFVVLSALFVVWELSKTFAAQTNYKITIGQAAWQYATYPTLDDALEALSAGNIDAVILDRRDLSDVMPEYPPDEDADIDTEELTYPQLVYLNDLDQRTQVGIFAIEPAFPGRLSVAVRAEDAENWQAIPQFFGENIATVSEEFAETNYLSVERRLVLADLKILNDINLPHLQTIAEAFMQPARRNGSQLLIGILADAGLYTWGEAVLGFAIGASLGLLLGIVFAHSALLERSLLPYVVASQTVPILAIAPMVVIWLGASQLSVAIIAAYLTFFPVTINTLRGLLSPDAKEIELLQSYAADTWTILWKLRFPSALPYIFTALKVSATASVVGAIIGELPSGIGDGLGRAILDFSSDYSLISTPKLWASIVMAASVGIVFFVIVTVIENLVLGRYIREV